MMAIEVITEGMEMKVGGERYCEGSIHNLMTEGKGLSEDKAKIWFVSSLDVLKNCNVS